ncbi:MAG: type III pantothenate kinase [Pseudomonadota bacterium]
MRALLIDAGNSRVKWGFWSTGRLQDSGVISTAAFRDGEAALPSVEPTRVLVSNVAGEQVARRLIDSPVAPEFVNAMAECGGVINAYSAPERLGVDRWMALLAARAEFDQACLVVDAGTAVTLDALAADGQHIGGQILPGAPLMMTSLASGTSDLPDLETEAGIAPASAELFATATDDAIRRGSWTAVIGAVDVACRSLRDREGDVRLVLTGGDAPRMLNAMAMPVEHRPDLVLHGLAVMLESTA